MMNIQLLLFLFVFLGYFCKWIEFIFDNQQKQNTS